MMSGLTRWSLDEQVTPFNMNAPLWFEVQAYMESVGYMAVDIVELHYAGKSLFQIDILFRCKTPVPEIPNYLNPAVNLTLSKTLLETLERLSRGTGQ